MWPLAFLYFIYVGDLRPKGGPLGRAPLAGWPALGLLIFYICGPWPSYILYMLAISGPRGDPWAELPWPAGRPLAFLYFIYVAPGLLIFYICWRSPAQGSIGFAPLRPRWICPRPLRPRWICPSGHVGFAPGPSGRVGFAPPAVLDLPRAPPAT